MDFSKNLIIGISGTAAGLAFLCYILSGYILGVTERPKNTSQYKRNMIIVIMYSLVAGAAIAVGTLIILRSIWGG
jgi:hypothetical protein